MAKAGSSIRFISPMAAQPVTELPEGDDWLYELKWDGYRAPLMKHGKAVQIRSRNDKDLTAAYPGIVAAGGRLEARDLVLDGEIVALAADGRPSFQALQHRGSQKTQQIMYYAFDVLHLDGRDLTGEPLTARRARLKGVLGEAVALRESDDLPGTANDIIAAVRAAGLEGVIAKRRESIYQPGARSDDWRKLRLDRQQEFVVGGYRPDGPNSLESLLVGIFEGKALKFAGKVRAGFASHSRRELVKALKPHIPTKCPFVNLPDERHGRWGNGVTVQDMKELQWVKPALVVQVSFVEWAAEGRLRHASFLGVRADKSAIDVRRES